MSKMKLMVEEGETFLYKYADFNFEWDGVHLIEDMDNPRRELDI